MRLVLVIFLLLLSPVQAFAQANGSATPPAAETPAATTTPPAGSPAPETVAQPSPAALSPGAAAVSPSILPKDLSVWGMFMAADWLVQAVMVGLAVASVVTWTVFVAKSLELAAAFRRQRAVLLAVDGAPSLDDAPANALVAAALAERKLSADSVDDREA
ncbi:MAG TPA: hypothetical protein VKA75_18625 [Reyranella sp.]|nr:hypothetical protein [Reyranella sp.]